MKIQESKGRFHVTLPKQYVRLLGWQRGTELTILPSTKEKELLIKEMPAIVR